MYMYMYKCMLCDADADTTLKTLSKFSWNFVATIQIYSNTFLSTLNSSLVFVPHILVVKHHLQVFNYNVVRKLHTRVCVLVQNIILSRGQLVRHPIRYPNKTQEFVWLSTRYRHTVHIGGVGLNPITNKLINFTRILHPDLRRRNPCRFREKSSVNMNFQTVPVRTIIMHVSATCPLQTESLHPEHFDLNPDFRWCWIPDLWIMHPDSIIFPVPVKLGYIVG